MKKPNSIDRRTLRPPGLQRVKNPLRIAMRQGAKLIPAHLRRTP